MKSTSKTTCGVPVPGKYFIDGALFLESHIATREVDWTTNLHEDLAASFAFIGERTPYLSGTPCPGSTADGRDNADASTAYMECLVPSVDFGADAKAYVTTEVGRSGGEAWIDLRS